MSASEDPKKYEEGAPCHEDGCEGVLKFIAPPECSCHLHPPCYHCIEQGLVCSECSTRPENPKS